MKRLFSGVLFIASILTVLSVFSQNPDQVYGPKFPPPSGTSLAGGNGDPGRTGGRNIYTSQVSLASNTATYWGLEYTTGLQMMVSLDGADYSSPGEVLTFDPTNSNLPAGIARWTGTTHINSAFGGSQTVYIRATLTATKLDNTIIPLVDPTSLGLSDQIGGLILINGVADFVVGNYLIEASVNQVSGYQPYLNFYDAYPTPIGPPPGSGGNAYSSFTNGFYWVNTPPRLDTNTPLTVTEGSSGAITTSILTAQDMEDLPSNPQGIVFSFESAGTTPVTYGAIQRNGVALGLADHFTQKDLQDGTLTYVNDGSESATDEFQFSFADSNGKPGIDNGHSVYSFHINITPVNDPPVTSNLSFETSSSVPLVANLAATDPDNATVTYSIVAPPTKGNVVLNNATTGAFTYTPTLGSTGIDLFTYTANDGTVDGNTSVVTITLLDLPPTVTGDALLTHENVDVSKSFNATDPESEPLTFTIVSPPSKGTLINMSGSSYTYHPAAGKFGKDSFTFTATDNQSNTSNTGTVSIDILPTVDRGDLLVADGNSIRLVDPVTQLDTVLVSGGFLSNISNVFGQVGTSLFALDKTNGIIKINRKTLAQTIITPGASFSSNPGLQGVAMNSTGNLIVTDISNNVFKVDTLTGAKTTLFTGGNLGAVTSAAYLNNGDLIVADASAFFGGVSRLIRITPAGVQTVISSGGSILVPIDFSLVDQNTAVVANAGAFAGGVDNILTVNLTTGAQQVLSTGGNLGFPSGTTFDDVTGKFYVINQNTKKLLNINTTVGTQSVVAANDGFNNPSGVQVVLAPAAAVALTKPYVTIPDDKAIVSSTTAALTATAVTGATTYTIEINTSQTFDGTGFVKMGAKMQNFAGLAYGTKYYTRVKTNLSPVYGSITSFSIATVDQFTYVVTPMNASVGVNISLSVSSHNVIGATTYTIELNTDQNFSPATALTKSGTITQAFSGLALDTRYYTRVKTNLSATWGPSKYFNTGTAVSLCYITSPADNATKVSTIPTITVNNIHATSYTVEIATDNLFTTGLITQTRSVKTFPFTGLSYGTKYYAHVSSNLGGFGPVRSFTTVAIADISYLVTPANNATNVNYSTNLTVNTVPGASLYTIEANTKSDFTGTSIQKQSASTTAAFLLQPNTSYWVRVYTNLNELNWGVSKTFKTTTPEALSHITSPANNATNVSYSVNLVANPVPTASQYTIEANPDAGFSPASAITRTGTSTTMGFSLAFNTKYYVRVTTDINSNWGNTKSFTTGDPVSLAFITSPIMNGTGVPTTVKVISNPVPGATAYIIQLDVDPNFPSPITISGTTRGQTFSGLSANTTYYARAATNLVPGAFGPISQFTTVNPGARETSDWMGESDDTTVAFSGFHLNVFPNPFRERFGVLIESDKQEDAQIVLYDINGRSIIEGQARTNQFLEINGAEFTPGIYILKTRIGDELRVAKVAKY